MHWIDLVIVAVIALTTFAAFRNGLIREVVPLLSIVVGAVVAGQLYDNLAADIDFIVDSEATRNFIAFLAIFGGIVVLGHIASFLLRTMARVMMLGHFDHIGGAVFGLLKSLFFVEIVLFAITTFPVSDALTEALDESALAPVFLDYLPVMQRLLPSEFDKAIDAFQEGATILPR